MKFTDQGKGMGVDNVKHKKHYDYKLSEDYIFRPAVKQFDESNRGILELEEKGLKANGRTQ